MNEQIDNLLPLIKMINEKMEKRINRELKKYDLTFSQIRVIVLLKHSSKDNYTMKQLEKIFQVSQQTLAGIIKRLESKHMIVSYADSKDKRVKRIKLTENGNNLGTKAYDMMRNIEDWSEKALHPSELNTLLSLLHKVYNYME